MELIDKKSTLRRKMKLSKSPPDWITDPLQENIKTYKDAANSLISTLKAEKKLLDDIRPLGRLMEQNALRKEIALELRRYEKNYIIYREAAAINNVERISKEILRIQPGIGVSFTAYKKAL